MPSSKAWIFVLPCLLVAAVDGSTTDAAVEAIAQEDMNMCPFDDGALHFLQVKSMRAARSSISGSNEQSPQGYCDAKPDASSWSNFCRSSAPGVQNCLHMNCEWHPSASSGGYCDAKHDAPSWSSVCRSTPPGIQNCINPSCVWREPYGPYGPYGPEPSGKCESNSPLNLFGDMTCNGLSYQNCVANSNCQYTVQGR
mmetsp:Transcript_35384/g.84819  ORF Transcript_35384/g.84819 Transcript_35384/m.84819 type:complete len:197 (+) Transcript_35384:70-660(+)